MAKTYEQKIEDLSLDDHNANLGSERGRYMLDNSLRQYGAGRSILVDKNGKIIAGNKTVEAASDIELDDIIVVETDGTKLVAVKRTDLDLDTDENARLLAYADNRTSEFLNWSPDVIGFDIEQGVDLSGMFQDFEIDNILGNVQAETYDFNELDQELDDLEGYQEVDIKITIPAMHKGAVMDWLANGESLTSPGMGKGVLKRCELL